MDTGVSTKPIEDFEAYKKDLGARMNSTVSTLSQMFRELQKNPRCVLFAEAEEMRVIRAALSFRDGGYGTVILVGQKSIVKKRLSEAGGGTWPALPLKVPNPTRTGTNFQTFYIKGSLVKAL
jgi:malate dehydrogenase (oxaloacetate-decarboxylating)(NADP+)